LNHSKEKSCNVVIKTSKEMIHSYNSSCVTPTNCPLCVADKSTEEVPKELKYNPVIGCVVCQQQVSKVEDFIPETLHTHKWNYEGYEDHLLVKGVRKNGLNKKGCPKELAAVYIIHPNGECQGGK